MSIKNVHISTMYVQRWAFVYLVNIESCDFNLRRLVAEDLELLRTIGYDYGWLNLTGVGKHGKK